MTLDSASARRPRMRQRSGQLRPRRFASRSGRPMAINSPTQRSAMRATDRYGSPAETNPASPKLSAKNGARSFATTAWRGHPMLRPSLRSPRRRALAAIQLESSCSMSRPTTLNSSTKSYPGFNMARPGRPMASNSRSVPMPRGTSTSGA